MCRFGRCVRASTVPRLPRRLSYRAAGERSAAADTVPNQDPIRDQRDWDRNRAAPARTVCVQTATRSGTSRHARADSHCAAAPSHLDWAQYPGGEPGQGWRAGRRDSRVRARRCVSERGSRFDWLCPCLDVSRVFPARFAGRRPARCLECRSDTVPNQDAVSRRCDCDEDPGWTVAKCNSFRNSGTS